tara:strand:+ start:4621 stop:5004 length:384 start_codon:yes stop_codon:yes gene_type:complete
MKKIELEKKIKALEEKSDNLDSAIGLVNAKTKEIKYNDVPSDIYLKVESYAEEYGIDKDDLEWKIKEVRECVNKLESAIYDLVEPFEDLKRSVDNDKDEAEWDLEELLGVESEEEYLANISSGIGYD